MEQTLACKQWFLAADWPVDIRLLDYQSTTAKKTTIEQTLACKQWLLAADWQFDITLLDYQSERPTTLTAASLPRRLRSTAQTILRNVLLPSEAPTFRVVCPSLGPGVAQVVPPLMVHVLRLLFHVSVPPRETQFFAERIWVKAASECQDLPDLPRAAHLLQVLMPPLLFLGPQERGETGLRKL